jgi:hypothetical protein
VSIPVIQARRFIVGDYEVIAQPIPHSAHMLRYNVFRNGKRIGGLASVPTESDCRFLEHPPVVPPLKTYSVTNRPGRPKKGEKRPTTERDRAFSAPREELPHGIGLPDTQESQDS